MVGKVSQILTILAEELQMALKALFPVLHQYVACATGRWFRGFRDVWGKAELSGELTSGVRKPLGLIGGTWGIQQGNM